MGLLLACPMCAKEAPGAARLLWVDLALTAVPFAAVAAGAWLFARILRGREGRS